MKKSVLLLCAGIYAGGFLFATDYKAKAQIKFLGDARVHSFEGTVSSQATILKENQGQFEGVFTVEVLNMNTSKDARDKEMRHMLNFEKCPVIVGTLKNAKLANGQKLSFPLVINGVEALVEAEVKDVQVEANKIHFHLDFPVSLEKHQLKAPSFLMGAIKVKDTVKVSVDVDGTI